MKSNFTHQRTPKYFSSDLKTKKKPVLGRLEIEVPEDDEEIALPRYNTTPHASINDKGFFKHGKNSPKANAVFNK